MGSPATPQHTTWSWSLGRISGIEVRVHAALLVFLAWIALGPVLDGHGLGAALDGVLTVAVVFGIIVLHEMGHALTARRYGIGTRDITLLPMGGVARLDRQPSVPRQELLVALAGPGVNLALAALAAVTLAVLGGPWSPELLAGASAPTLIKFMWINVGLAAFNLLPAFPMDGGRVVRALCAMRMDRARATRIAARLGQGMALLLGAAGLFLSPMLLFVALFVWIGASQEAAAAEVEQALEGVTVGDVMVTAFTPLPAHTPVHAAVRFALHSGQRAFPVVDGDALVGVVGVDELSRSGAAGGGEQPVSAITPAQTDVAAPDDALAPTLARLLATERPAMAVLCDGRLRGLLPASAAALGAAAPRDWRQPARSARRAWA